MRLVTCRWRAPPSPHRVRQARCWTMAFSIQKTSCTPWRWMASRARFATRFAKTGLANRRALALALPSTQIFRLGNGSRLARIRSAKAWSSSCRAHPALSPCRACMSSRPNSALPATPCIPPTSMRQARLPASSLSRCLTWSGWPVFMATALPARFATCLRPRAACCYPLWEALHAAPSTSTSLSVATPTCSRSWRRLGNR